MYKCRRDLKGSKGFIRERSMCNRHRFSIQYCFSFTFQDNYSALHIAVQYCKPLVVQTLLGYGAQVQLKGGKVSLQQVKFMDSTIIDLCVFCAWTPVLSLADVLYRRKYTKCGCNIFCFRFSEINLKNIRV